MGNAKVYRVLGIITLLLQVACGNQNNNANGYYLANGVCYSTQNGQVANPSFCSGGYVNQNGNCYSNAGQVVNSGTCGTVAQNGYPYTNGYNNPYGASPYTQTPANAMPTPMSCVGNFTTAPAGYNTGMAAQTIACNGANCAGYTLYNASGAAVLCQ